MREIAVIGVGMGTPGSMTVEAADFCRGAQLLIGAERMLGAVEMREGQIRCVEYLPDRVCACIEAHPEAERVAILLSGDVGFFSGAKKLLEAIPDAAVYSGISSAVCFAGRLRMSWEDWKLTSSHGRHCNLIGEIARNKKVFTILGTKDAAAEICRKLVYYGLDGIRIHIGENLGYPEERLLSGVPEDFAEHAGTPLSVMLIENPSPRRTVVHGIPDEEFIRDKVPMTKEEVREISSSIRSSPTTLKISRQVAAAAMGIMTELVRKSKKESRSMPSGATPESRLKPRQDRVPRGSMMSRETTVAFCLPHPN